MHTADKISAVVHAGVAQSGAALSWCWLVSAPMTLHSKKIHIINAVEGSDSDHSAIFPMIPAGLPLIGFLVQSGSKKPKEAAGEFVSAHITDINKQKADSLLSIILVSGTDSTGTQGFVIDADNILHEISVILDHDIFSLKPFPFFHLQFQRTIYNDTAVEDTLNFLRGPCIFYVPSVDKLLELDTNNESNNTELKDACTILLPAEETDKNTNQKSQKKIKNIFLQEYNAFERRPIRVELFRKASNGPKMAPILQYAPLGELKQLCVDVLCYGCVDSTVESILKQFCRTASAQLSMLATLDYDMASNIHANIAKTYHFYQSPTLPHPITIGYLSNSTLTIKENDQFLKSQRISYHKQFLLPEVQLLRFINSIRFDVEEDSFQTKHANKLINPHLALKTSAVKENVAIVKGFYTYHHYMQDKFDDKGWGCAYRTFQTLCSWFILQRYVSQEQAVIPDHRTIQKALVELKERKRSFIGSRQWIGAIELGFLLKHFFGVVAKNIFVPSGGEVINYARSLREHFRTEGTPVMIGGGMLAYGLLGVDLNEKTGEVRFLILDPHYVGPDDLKPIINKKWCAWKGPELFLNNAFYNFCCPQRPRDI